MNIAILGTRGIPNNHGGFEQFAEFLSVYLVKNGHQVTVYNSHNHPYRKKEWEGVSICHCYDPEYIMGTAGQFIYDLNCIIDIRKKSFDLILQLGYTSSSIWNKWLPNNPTLVTNMDGLEWKRSKYNNLTKKFLKYAESLAVKHSDFLISDSTGIQEYLKNSYNVVSEYIPYGAQIFNRQEESILKDYNLESRCYNMLVARLEPENNIEMILDGVSHNGEMPFLVVGKHLTKYGEHLKEKYKTFNWIIFLGGIYNQNHLNNLRFYSNLYFHGHSVGGTNPSLLEAMGCSALIVAHDNIFNRGVLKDEAFYFSDSDQVAKFLALKKTDHTSIIIKNLEKIRTTYAITHINKTYDNFFLKCQRAL